MRVRFGIFFSSDPFTGQRLLSMMSGVACAVVGAVQSLGNVGEWLGSPMGKMPLSVNRVGLNILVSPMCCIPPMAQRVVCPEISERVKHSLRLHAQASYGHLHGTPISFKIL